MNVLTDFVLIFALAWGINLAVYFGLGWAILAVNARAPERKLQPNRDGLKRAKAEMRESVRSIAVTAACLALALTLQLHGLTVFAPWEGWLGTLGGVVVLVVLYDTWYYWAHRLLHTRAFYRFHQWHHRSVAPTVWSSDSQSAVETLMIQSFQVVAAVLLPVPAAALVLHRIYDHVNGQLGHAGTEHFAGPAARAPWPMVCIAYHDAHHEKFRFNYSNYFSLWDRIMGTIAPGYDAWVEAQEREAGRVDPPGSRL